MSRWCQVTKTHFLYYAEGVPYASYLGRPLAVIPLDTIKSVKRVCVEVPEKTEKYSNLKNYQFEIFFRSSNSDDNNNKQWVSKVMDSVEDAKEYPSPLKQEPKNGKKFSNKSLNS